MSNMQLTLQEQVEKLLIYLAIQAMGFDPNQYEVEWSRKSLHVESNNASEARLKMLEELALIIGKPSRIRLR